MKEKELRALSRADLLQMLIDQSALVEELRQRLEIAEAELEKREIAIAKAGSLAEAALALNGVFEAAQNACDQYMENIRLRSPAAVEQEVKKAKAQLLSIQRQCKEQEQQTKLRCAEMVTQAKKQSQAHWDATKVKLDRYYDEHAGLRELLELSAGMNRD